MRNKLTEHQSDSRHTVIAPYEVGLILDRRDQAHQDLADALVVALDEYRHKFVGSDVVQLPFGHVADVARHLLSFALAQKKSRIVVVRDAGTSGDAVAAAFQSAARQLRTGRLHIVARDERLSAVLNDMRPDAVIYVGGNGHADIHASLKQAGLNALKLTGIEITSVHPALSACALDGWIGLDMVDDSNPRFQRFSQAFFQRYGRSAARACAAVGSDIGHVLAMTLSIVRPPSPAGVSAGLNKLRMVPAATGRAGTVISFARYDRRGFRGDPFVFSQAVDGKLRPLAPAAAA